MKDKCQLGNSHIVEKMKGTQLNAMWDLNWILKQKNDNSGQNGVNWNQFCVLLNNTAPHVHFLVLTITP